ncbi:hypothetical protein FS837_000974 [Tulasnella sp. UAMH 9824]|nr:hypothetical protein FS837_000974 [Tulasnella sp. UAMH 9824]
MSDKCPFWKTQKDVAVIAQVLYEKQTPSQEDHPGLDDPVLWDLLRRCWRYEPSERPTMIEVCKTKAKQGAGSPTATTAPSKTAAATGRSQNPSAIGSKSTPADSSVKLQNAKNPPQTPVASGSGPQNAKNAPKAPAASASGAQNGTPPKTSEARTQKPGKGKDKDASTSQPAKGVASGSSAAGPSGQLDFTGKVTTRNPPDTSYKLLNSYVGDVKGVKNVKKVTVKVLRMVGNGPNDPNYKKWTAGVNERLRREISGWMGLKGPFLQYVGYATVDGVPAVLTEFEEGLTAKEFLAKKPAEKRRLVSEFADAVKILHRAQLSHGNLEPRHFMVDKKGKAKLGGFRFNQMIEEELKKVNPSEEYRRSSRYTPPEVLENRPTSEKSDVYSFACVAVELLTGKIPFAATPQEAAVTQLAINGESHLTKQYAELQGDQLWTTLKSCWSKSPETRPSMDTLCEKVRLNI